MKKVRPSTSTTNKSSARREEPPSAASGSGSKKRKSSHHDEYDEKAKKRTTAPAGGDDKKRQSAKDEDTKRRPKKVNILLSFWLSFQTIAKKKQTSLFRRGFGNSSLGLSQSLLLEQEIRAIDSHGSLFLRMVSPLAEIDDRWIRYRPRCSPSCGRFAYFCFVKKTDGQIAFAPPPTLSQQNQSFTKKKKTANFLE